MKMKKSILFICVENACRSQMAEAFANQILEGWKIQSAGLKETPEINPNAVQVMKEIGIEMIDQYPKVLTTEMVDEADLIITMGCIDQCPIVPKEKTRDWALIDPKGKDLNFFRKTREIIKDRIQKLKIEYNNGVLLE